MQPLDTKANKKASFGIGRSVFCLLAAGSFLLFASWFGFGYRHPKMSILSKMLAFFVFSFLLSILLLVLLHN